MEQILVLILATALMVLISRPAQGWTDPNDVFALSILYSSLEYPELSGWKALGGDPCQELWQGLECEGPNVTAIKLPGLNLGGTLGYALDNLTSLLTMDLSNNHIGQRIPYQLPPHVQKLNFSNNRLDAQVPDNFKELSDIISMDLSSNKLTGVLPASFGNLTSLSTLHLQDNQLSGNIDILQQLPLQDLDIESNNFSGWIPPSLLKIASFRYDGNQLKIAAASSPPPAAPPHSQPKAPTGAPPKPSILEKHPPSNGSLEVVESKKTRQGYWNVGRIAATVSAAILSIIAVMILGIFLKRAFEKEVDKDLKGLKDSSTGLFPSYEKVNQMEKIETHISVTQAQGFLKPFQEQHKAPAEKISGKAFSKKVSKAHISATEYTVAELQLATDSFGQQNLLGEGSFGKVYRGKLLNGKLVAIKKVDGTLSSVQNEDEFLASVSILARLRHANIVKLVGYCAEHGQRLLAYEYFGVGTLHDHLHDKCETNGTKLSWDVRVKIALGAARALEYLHEMCPSPVVHKNFTSANILLENNLVPHLSDCGIASLFHHGHEHQVSAPPLCSFGYSAPEYNMSEIYTAKGDVYSFGIVMLELLTGRKALDRCKPRGEQLLVGWATPRLHDIDALAKMVDPLLNGIYPAKSLSRFADIVSTCIQPEPEFRPQMSEIVQELVLLMQHANSAKGGSSDDIAASQQSIDHQETSDFSV